MGLEYLIAQKLCFSYADMPVINNWSGKILASDLLHLQGANGSGKSTLLKLLAGILLPESGALETFVQLGFVGHHLGLHPMLTVHENLKYAPGASEFLELEQYLIDAKLHDQLHRPLANLSLGQQHKVSMLRLMAQGTKLWLLDEPFANLDVDAEAWLWGIILQHRLNGGAVVLTAHQRDFSDKGAYQWQMI
jgi:heme exporter protein A